MAAARGDRRGPPEEGGGYGRCNPQLSMLAFVDLDARIPADHPLRRIKRFAGIGLCATGARAGALHGLLQLPLWCLGHARPIGSAG